MVKVVLLWLHDDECANNVTTGGRGTAEGVIAAVELAQVGVAGTGIAVALRAAGAVRALDVPGDLPGHVAGYSNINMDSGPGAERVRREGGGDGQRYQRLAYPGQGTTAMGSA